MVYARRQQSNMLITRLDGAAAFRDTSGQPQLFEPFPLLCSLREGREDMRVRFGRFGNHTDGMQLSVTYPTLSLDPSYLPRYTTSYID
jgi:hypothetical protein